MDETRLRQNLSLIRQISLRADVEFIMAFKAFALWRTFPIFREYISHTASSSLYEARLAFEEFGSKSHIFSPAYEEDTFSKLLPICSHLTFNSLSQYERFKSDVCKHQKNVAFGLRINPEYSEITTELYNPCARGSRFGVLSANMPERLPEGISGLHCHNHCESDSYALAHTLEHITAKFDPWLRQAEWLNLGGGHLVTRADYDVEHLIRTINDFHKRYPHLHIIFEPGSAFTWQTGELYAKVIDIVENYGIRTAILNVSFTCHMPDCLEMPYHPEIIGAKVVSPSQSATGQHLYRLGGNSCLSGDYMGTWEFAEPLHVGDILTFCDMIHYTTVKTNMFNGVSHPSLCLRKEDGSVQVLRTFQYEDYRDRMD
ncbi:MAG: carboxynorspermidine decarboxylase [Alloprevotella sp.]|nr:carboxynorspermidine decarboxylase [Alloprevotella sp.]